MFWFFLALEISFYETGVLLWRCIEQINLILAESWYYPNKARQRRRRDIAKDSRRKNRV
jgi:hypothetical protein